MTTRSFHPELARARFLPPIPFGPRTLGLLRATPKVRPAPDDVRIENATVPGLPGNPEVGLRIYRPTSVTSPGAALFWLHGGGYLIGTAEQDERSSIDFARSLGITVVAGRYRLAPENPFPAAIDDAYAGLLGMVADADRLGVDPARIAIGGASAGAGLAAGLALRACDEGTVHPVFQLLRYPMLDDRTVLRADMDTHNVRGWTPHANRFGWTSYLGVAPGSPDVSPYAAPARREDLSGLPPAWIGVGTLDLFYDEDLAYAERLRAAGVQVETEVVPGAFHGFDALMANAGVSRRFWDQQARALRRALLPET